MCESKTSFCFDCSAAFPMLNNGEDPGCVASSSLLDGIRRRKKNCVHVCVCSMFVCEACFVRSQFAANAPSHRYCCVSHFALHCAFPRRRENSLGCSERRAKKTSDFGGNSLNTGSTGTQLPLRPPPPTEARGCHPLRAAASLCYKRIHKIPTGLGKGRSRARPRLFTQ